MPNTAEIAESRPRGVRWSLRVRKRRDDLVPAARAAGVQPALVVGSSHARAVRVARARAVGADAQPGRRPQGRPRTIPTGSPNTPRAFSNARPTSSSTCSREPRLSGMPRIAYFCAEFAIAESLPIYSGGLGVLAGDSPEGSQRSRPAAGRRRPAVSLRLLPPGHRRDRLPARSLRPLDTDAIAVRPVLERAGRAGRRSKCRSPAAPCLARVWLAQVGRVPLYLLDTDLAENREDDRWITGHLYGGDQDTRIRQEIVLGIGGLRALRAILPADAQPDVMHMNEGHSAFLALELARERLVSGAAQHVRRGGPAGRAAPGVHHPHPGRRRATTPSRPTWSRPTSTATASSSGCRTKSSCGAAHESTTSSWERFSMTVLALRSAARRNGVSQLHGKVSKEMWRRRRPDAAGHAAGRSRWTPSPTACTPRPGSDPR